MRGAAPSTGKRRKSSEAQIPGMTAGEDSPAVKKEALNGSGAAAADHGGILHETVITCVRQYLREIDGEPTTDFYQLVLSQVEPPLLREVMAYTRHNQTRAAQMLGLNRGTLRKKLRQYDISPDSQ